MAQAYAAAGVSSMAQASSVPRLFTTSFKCLPALPHISPRSASLSSSSSASFKNSSGSNRLALLKVKASSSEESSGSVDVGEAFSDIKEKWNTIENKSMVILYGGGAIVALWLSSVIVDAINSVPLLPKVTEVIGLGYTGWFVYRYLLFKSSRTELAAEIEALKKKIAGSE